MLTIISAPVIKTVLKFAANRIVFNPMEAMNLAVASEDHNLYFNPMKPSVSSEILIWL